MSKELQQLSEGLAWAVDKAARSVVSVDARARFPATGVVWSADGEIITADHVVQRDEDIRVTLPNGETQEASVVGRDPASDLALLKVETSGLTVPEWVEAVKVGSLVLAVGRPSKVQAALGSVVATGGPVRGWHRRLDAFIQADVTMYPGFSGGPLADVSGRVAGINSSALARGASLAVPVPVVRSVAEALKQDGRVKRGYLGISTQPVKLPEAMAARLNQRTGLMIIGVEDDGPAVKGGLMQGDVLVGLDGSAVTDIEALQGLLGLQMVGKTVNASVIRGGDVKDISVTVGERP